MPRWTEQQLRDAVGDADSLSDVLRAFGLRTSGANHARLRAWIDRWSISIDHFTRGRDKRVGRPRTATPLEEVLVASRPCNRARLKRRLFDAGLKERRCELCGQGELWRGQPLGLIPDHVNGVADDNRLENLRIVCPNCNATLPTHCGRNLPATRELRPCALCGEEFRPNFRTQQYCSRACGQRSRQFGPRLAARRVERPPYEQLLEEIATSSWSAVGRKYGVSCNAVRKWVQMEQRLRAEAAEATEAAAADGGADELSPAPAATLAHEGAP